ncbi:MAG: hypothetical protein ACR2F6_10865 [Mycobacteriales bacterium]
MSVRRATLAGLLAVGVLIGASACARRNSDSNAAGTTSGASASGVPSAPAPTSPHRTAPTVSGSTGTGSTGTGSSPSPAAVTVKLATTFRPRSVRLRVGQRLTIEVAKSVTADLGTGSGRTCRPGSGSAVLKVVCGTPPTVRYVAQSAGTTTIDALVRPKCAAGAVCPKWVTSPSLTVVVA